jgi:putative ABC transport system permease protein
MLRATVKSVLARKLRLALSAFAIVLGVAFVAGSYVFTDTIDQTFEEIFAETTADIVVRPTQSGAGTSTSPAAMLAPSSQCCSTTSPQSTASTR